MNTRRSRRIRPGTAEQLLQGAPVPVPDPLARLLASAAAPPQPGELAREEAAVAAFHAARLAPVAASRRGQMVTPPPARFLTTKVAALALVICTTGGIALAATVVSGSPHGSGSAERPAVAGEGGHEPAVAGVPPGRPGAGHLSGRGTRRPGGLGTPGAAAVPVARLCLTLTSDVHAILMSRPGPGPQAAATGQHRSGNAYRRNGGSAGRRGSDTAPGGGGGPQGSAAGPQGSAAGPRAARGSSAWLPAARRRRSRVPCCCGSWRIRVSRG